METSVKAAKVLLPPEADVAPSSSLDADSTPTEAAAAPCASSSSSSSDPMEEFGRRLEDIVSSSSLVDTQGVMELQEATEEVKEDLTVAMETEASRIKQSLNISSTPEEKLQDVVGKFAELVVLRRCDEKKLCVLQQTVLVLQAERRSSFVTRSKLESLCRDLQRHYEVLREETLQRCREDEEKRKEMNSHFQQMLSEIQTQIEQHSVRNDKLCHENTHLTDKLESLMNQCELREQSLEKINRHRDLEHKLTEAKLEQANALLAEAEERHKREKEYLLREAIDKTKKCYAMKEQELAMKKQLTLYSQKFDEFQETLGKSNEIYVRFKKEMENMSDKMKKLEKESNLWKTRFENCNKALTDMIEERTEKGKELDLFVLKIHRLEKLCRALQDERTVLYEKIKEVRRANSSLSAKVFGESKLSDDSDDKSALLTPLEVQELQETDPVLTEDMARLREEQAKLQEFAASLLDPVADNEEDNDIDLEEDLVSAAFVQFKTKIQVKKDPVSVPEEPVVVVKSEAAEPDFPQSDKAEEVQKPDRSAPEENSSDPQSDVPTPVVDKEVQQVQTHEEQDLTPEVGDIQTRPLSDPKPEEVVAQTQVEDKEAQQVQTHEEPAKTAEVKDIQTRPLSDPKPEPAAHSPQVENKEVQQVQTTEEVEQQKPAEQTPTPGAEEVQIRPQSDPQPEAAEAAILEETGEIKPAEQQPTEWLQTETAAAASASSTKSVMKRRKKKSGRNVS